MFNSFKNRCEHNAKRWSTHNKYYMQMRGIGFKPTSICVEKLNTRGNNCFRTLLRKYCKLSGSYNRNSFYCLYTESLKC